MSSRRLRLYVRAADDGSCPECRLYDRCACFDEPEAPAPAVPCVEAHCTVCGREAGPRTDVCHRCEEEMWGPRNEQ